MRKVPIDLEYFTNSSVDQLKADATTSARGDLAASLSESFAGTLCWGPSIVIDPLVSEAVPGWPELKLRNVWSGWIVAIDHRPGGTRKDQYRMDAGFRRSGTDARIDFLARSLWYNDLIESAGK